MSVPDIGYCQAHFGLTVHELNLTIDFDHLEDGSTSVSGCAKTKSAHQSGYHPPKLAQPLSTRGKGRTYAYSAHTGRSET